VPAPWYPQPDITADVEDHEAAWLNTTGDGGPPLSQSAGGPWDVVQAFWPGSRLGQKKRGVYVTCRVTSDDHVNAQRYRDQYTIVLKLTWPVKTPNPPIAENEQRAFSAAIGLLLQRIRGPLGDKSHGGRFLSVGEVPGQASGLVEYEDPEVTIPADGELRATITYHADEKEFNG